MYFTQIVFADVDFFYMKKCWVPFLLEIVEECSIANHGSIHLMAGWWFVFLLCNLAYQSCQEWGWQVQRMGKWE